MLRNGADFNEGSDVPDHLSEPDRAPRLASRLTGVAKLIGFMGLTLPLMPLQAVLVRVSTPAARRFPQWYHRKVCRLLGVRVRVEGALERGVPVLLLANHSSWLDIPVISAAAPVSFVAKKEVSTWPFVSWLAMLQRTVFVDRTRRTTVGDTAGEMIDRLNAGDTLVLFAEGTSSDGNRVLPFKTSLISAAKPTRAARAGATGGQAPKVGQGPPAVVQTLAIVYTHRHGLPMGRADRPGVGWYGDMELGGHVWGVLTGGPIEVTVRLGPPVPLDDFADRKVLARHSETEIRADVVDLLRGGWEQKRK